MSRPVPSVPSPRAARPRRLIAVGLCAAGLAALPSAASAAPVTTTTRGHDEARSVAPEHQIKTMSVTTDSATGSWSTTVTFGAPQVTAPGPGLSVWLQLSNRKAATASWFLRTSPDPLPPAYANPNPLAGDQVPPLTVGFNPERTVLTVQATEPQLIGRTVDKVSAKLYNPDVDGIGYSAAQMFLGQRVPQARIPAAAKRLVVAADGRLRIPLSPLAVPAQRTVVVDLPHHHVLTGTTLRADDYRRRFVSVRLRRDQLRHLSRTPRAVTLTVRTQLRNGDRANASTAASIRRH